MAKQFQDQLLAAADGGDGERALFTAAALQAVVGLADPEKLLMTMVLLEPELAFRYATVAVLGSVTGAVGGYVLGYLSYLMLVPLFASQGWDPWLATITHWYHVYGPVVVLSAGFAPLPLWLVTSVSGFLVLGLLPFLPTIVLARGARFVLIAWLLWRGGPIYKEWIERNLYGLTMAGGVALMLAGVLLNYLAHNFV